MLPPRWLLWKALLLWINFFVRLADNYYPTIARPEKSVIQGSGEAAEINVSNFVFVCNSVIPADG